MDIVVVVEVAEEGNQKEVVAELAGVVKVGGMMVEVRLMMMRMMVIMICLNVRTGRGSDWRTLQSNPFKQTILLGSL